MLKHLGSHTKKLLWYIICHCLVDSTLSHWWSLAFIYPIPKPKLWEYDLNNTRPITLLECPQKALIKLLNRRLSTILIKHNVLKGLNFAGLPYKSTFELLRIVDNIKYNAIINNKDLWVLSQDMSKAYDRVNLFMLIRALERLRIPFNFIRFILKMFGNRFNQVFTSFGNTEPYKVVSGIDQGEVISPLLWCIYYDPLLCRIHESPLGYSMSHKWKPDIATSAIASNSIKISRGSHRYHENCR